MQLPMKAIGYWVAIVLGSSSPLLMPANKGIDFRICPRCSRLWRRRQFDCSVEGADDTGDDLKGASKFQFIETESRPRKRALHETSRFRPCSVMLFLGRYENVTREEAAITSARGYWVSHRNAG